MRGRDGEADPPRYRLAMARAALQIVDGKSAEFIANFNKLASAEKHDYYLNQALVGYGMTAM